MPTEPQGRFLGIPYDLRRPTWRRARERMFNPDDSRLLTPHSFGWGYSLNLGAPVAWARRRRQ
jgi:hypothetical protein